MPTDQGYPHPYLQLRMICNNALISKSKAWQGLGGTIALAGLAYGPQKAPRTRRLDFFGGSAMANLQ
jgi:hypothetical protein